MEVGTRARDQEGNSAQVKRVCRSKGEDAHPSCLTDASGNLLSCRQTCDKTITTGCGKFLSSKSAGQESGWVYQGEFKRKRPTHPMERQAHHTAHCGSCENKRKRESKAALKAATSADSLSLEDFAAVAETPVAETTTNAEFAHSLGLDSDPANAEIATYLTMAAPDMFTDSPERIHGTPPPYDGPGRTRTPDSSPDKQAASPISILREANAQLLDRAETAEAALVEAKGRLSELEEKLEKKERELAELAAHDTSTTTELAALLDDLCRLRMAAE